MIFHVCHTGTKNTSAVFECLANKCAVKFSYHQSSNCISTVRGTFQEVQLVMGNCVSDHWSAVFC